MRKLLLVLGTLAVLVVAAVGAVLIVGALQPADHVATARMQLAAPPGEVWQRVIDFENWPDWNTAFDKAARQSDRDGKAYWLFEGDFGSMPMLVEERVVPTRLVTRIPSDAELGFSGTWTYTLAAVGDGATLVSITENGHVDSLLFRGIGALFMDPYESVNLFLTDLARSFGEAAVPQAVR